MKTYFEKEEPIFKVANCRGKKPLINDIKKAVRILSMLKIELNDCKGRRTIAKAIENLENDLISDNPEIKIYK